MSWYPPLIVADLKNFLYIYRSKDFRPSYRRLRELHAFVPQGTPYMACTATATRDVHIKLLEMSDCVNVNVSPDRPNIFYGVEIRTEIESDFSDLIVSLRQNQVQTSRVIVYCQSLNMCADLYAHFHFELGSSSYYPDHAPHVSDNRLFGMFHSCTPHYNKDVILKSLGVPDGTVRVVFATVALGMGIDLKSSIFPPKTFMNNCKYLVYAFFALSSAILAILHLLRH